MSSRRMTWAHRLFSNNVMAVIAYVVVFLTAVVSVSIALYTAGFIRLMYILVPVTSLVTIVLVGYLDKRFARRQTLAKSASDVPKNIADLEDKIQTLPPHERIDVICKYIAQPRLSSGDVDCVRLMLVQLFAESDSERRLIRSQLKKIMAYLKDHAIQRY